MRDKIKVLLGFWVLIGMGSLLQAYDIYPRFHIMVLNKSPYRIKVKLNYLSIGRHCKPDELIISPPGSKRRDARCGVMCNEIIGSLAA